jgi:hypothetical protein
MIGGRRQWVVPANKRTEAQTGIYRRAVQNASFWAAAALLLASAACSNPIQSYFATRDSNQSTATASMWTPTPTDINTPRPVRTRTPTTAQTHVRTKTPTASSSMPNRYFEKRGDVIFSYVPPASWKIVPGSGSILTSWEGPTQQGGDSSCALNFMIAESDESVADAAKRELDPSGNPPGTRIISQEKFSNDAGVDAYKAVIVISNQETNIQVVFYFFQNRGYLIMAWYGRLVEQNKEQDVIVDASMKTLRYE